MWKTRLLWPCRRRILPGDAMPSHAWLFQTLPASVRGTLIYVPGPRSRAREPHGLEKKTLLNPQDVVDKDAVPPLGPVLSR